jgi:uncharacterized protein YggU (UPF0235/DUF167 family)
MSDYIVTVIAKPGSTSPGLSWDASHLVIRVRERAVDGKANEAVRRALAKALDTAPSRVALVRGARSKEKLFAVSGLTRATIDAKLARLRG